MPTSTATQALFLTCAFALAPIAIAAQTAGDFACAPIKGTTPLSATTRYSATAAGWDLAAAPDTIAKGFCSSKAPFFFSIAEPDGNYQVTLVLGGTEASTMTIKAESRRLMVDRLAIPANTTKTVTFNVNVRQQLIGTGPDAKSVKLKPREIGALDWDEKLTLEFNGDHPSVRSIRIQPVKVPTIYVAGDSTVVDQDKEPWAAWGQMLPAFLNDKVAVSNQAESGETSKSFVGERRLEKIMSTMQSGDYLMIQFGHNDQKQGGGYVAPQGEFKDLMRSYIAQARAKGATVILVTPMNRRNFDPSGHITATLGEYPQAMKDIAAEEKVGLIDLNAMSKTLYEAMGKDGTLHAFVHYPANTFPDQPQELKDDTHFNTYGAYELARAIVQSIATQDLPLKPYLVPGIAPFDPARPDALAKFTVPASPFVSTTTPYGR